MKFERALVDELAQSLAAPPPFLQVVAGPRQVGKSTAARQVAARLGWPCHAATADAPRPPGPDWIEGQWEIARQLARRQRALLILDEVQKVAGWSEIVKKLWDREMASNGLVRPILLGSSALLLQQGLSESLAGRFFLHRLAHWSWPECAAAFGWSLEQWLYFGGYPGAAPLIRDEARWKSYVTDSLIETVVARDVLQMQTVHKPALLRQLFALAGTYPAQILSYTKMLGQLQEAGNTTTLAHYLRLLETAFLASGLERFSRGKIRQRGSSPKLVLWNNALINAPGLRTQAQARAEGAWWGRLVENAAGAHLLNHLAGPRWSVTYWRDGAEEVDFVVTNGTSIWALEIKSGRAEKTAGLAAFKREYPEAKILLIGGDGVPLAEFFRHPPAHWFE